MELIGNWVFNKSNWACVGAQFSQWVSAFDIEDLDQTREVRRGDEKAIAAKRGGGNDVGEGGDCGGGREGLGAEEGERRRVGSSEGMRGRRGVGERGYR